MKATITIVDNIRGTVVIDAEDSSVQLNHFGDSFVVLIDGEEQGPTTTGPSEPATPQRPEHIRTPEPEEQTLQTEIIDTETQDALKDTKKHVDCEGPYKLVFIQEMKSRIQAKCNNCGVVVYIDKNRYSEAQLTAITDAMIGYVKPTPPETPRKALETPETEKSNKDPETSSELKLDGPAPRKQANKRCQYCGDDFQGANRAMYCPRHKDPANRPPKQLPAPVAAEDDHPGPNTPLPEGHYWCIHHKSQQTHKSPDCPLIENAPERRVTDEEAAAFTDPWNCGRCRTDGRVCRFHRGMEATGSTPPANVHSL